MTGNPRRRHGLCAAVLALVLGAAGCGGGDRLDGWSSAPTRAQLPGQSTSAASSGAPTVDELRQGMLWQGEFTITIEVWDYCGGTGQLAKSNTYTRTESFSLETAPPVDYGPAARETNPFFVSAGTDPDVGGVVNLALQSTGVVALPGQEDDPYVIQFWQLAYNGGHLTGRLFQDGREYGIDWNRINDDTPLVFCQPQGPVVNLPFPMKEGATLDATITRDHVSMVIAGRSPGDERRWRVRASATRAG